MTDDYYSTRWRRHRELEEFALRQSSASSPTAMIMEEYVASSRHFRSSILSANALPLTPPAEFFHLKQGEAAPDAAATTRHLIDEPIFWREYTSDEEVASPLVDDDHSLDSDSFCYDSDVSIHNEPVTQRSTHCLGNGKTSGTQAQAVQYLSAGKPKVVSMPTPRIVRTAPSSPTKLPVSKMSCMNIEGRAINFSRTITSKTSRESDIEAKAPTAHTGVPLPTRVVRRMPDVPALQAVSRSQSPSVIGSVFVSPMSARRAGYVEPDDSLLVSPLSEAALFSQCSTPEDERPPLLHQLPSAYSEDDEPVGYPAHEASPVPDSPPATLSQKRGSHYILQSPYSAKRPAPFSLGSQPIQDNYTFPGSSLESRPRLLRKLSSTISFRAFSRRPSRQGSISSIESERLRAGREHTTSKSAHAIANMHIPSRTSSKPSLRMVPRGANERAPPIVIPPCPDDDYEGENSPPSRLVQPTRLVPMCISAMSDGNTAASIPPVTAPKIHQRKKSHSTSSGSGSL